MFSLLVNNIKINEHFFAKMHNSIVSKQEKFRLAHYFSNENPKHHHLTLLLAF